MPSAPLFSLIIPSKEPTDLLDECLRHIFAQHETRFEIILLPDGPLPAGEHETAWDGRDAGGRAVPGGVYFARVAADGQTTTCKMTLVK